MKKIREKTLKETAVLAILLFVFLTFLALLSGSANAQEKHMILLAYAESAGNKSGSVVNLYLEVKEGRGNTFIEMSPFSKIDTQITTKFAKNTACEIAMVDCRRYDFFYRLESESVIVGGPSASAAMAIITLAFLENRELDPHTAITGTLASGKIIGPVSGVKEKIDAARRKGIKRVLISSSIRNIEIKEGKDVKVVSLEEYSQLSGVEIIPVTFLEEAFAIMTKTKYQEKIPEIRVDEKYKETMKGIWDNLCGKSAELKKDAENLGIKINESTIELLKKSYEEAEKEKYYSGSSFCFNFNVELSSLLILEEDIDENELNKRINSLQKDIDEFREKIDRVSCKKITCLETKMIVTQRLDDSESVIQELIENNKSRKNLGQKKTDFAYAKERFYSAVYWSEFLNVDFESEKEINLDEIYIECLLKIKEAEELRQYVETITGLEYGIYGKDFIKKAESHYKSENYASCIYEALQAKSRFNALLSIISTNDEEEYVKNFLEIKSLAAKKEIVRQEQENRFPIGGYSYYEYAEKLKEEQPYEAIIYYEYSLELSNLDIYFDKMYGAAKFSEKEKFDARFLIAFGVGMITAVAIMMLSKLKTPSKLKKIRKKIKKHKKHKK